MRILTAATVLGAVVLAVLATVAGIVITEPARLAEQGQATALAASEAVAKPSFDQVRLFALTATSVSVRVVTDVSSTVTITYQTKGQPPRAAPGGSGQAHTVRLTGLAAGAVYDYQVQARGDEGAPGQAMGAWRFHTPLADQRNCAFGVIGDTQGDFSDVVQALSRQDLDLVVTTGDNVEMELSKKTPESVWGMWSDYYRKVISLTAQSPFYVTLGNHDVVWQRRPLVWQAYAEEVAPTQPVSSTYYSFDCGDAHFTVLDSETVTGTVRGVQWDWALNDLAASPKPLKIVVAHRPFIGSDSTPSLYWENGDLVPGTGGWGIFGGQEPAIRAMLKSKGVRLALAGHRHVYNRYMKDGIAYLINPTAALGRSLSANPAGATFSQAYLNVGGDVGTIESAIAKTGFMVGRLTDGVLSMVAMDRFGVVLDTFRVDLR